MNSRLMTLAGLAAVAAIALAWSAFAADGDGERQGNGERSDRFTIPVPPPPGEGDQMFHFRGPRGAVIPAPGEAGEHGAIPLPPPGHGPAGPGGPFGGELTYGELHVQRGGEDVVVRVDHGEIASVDEDSITVAENDGNEVEIPVDEDTEVHAGPFRGDLSLDDLEQGDTVHVSREDGGAAEMIGVLPELPPMPEGGGGR